MAAMSLRYQKPSTPEDFEVLCARLFQVCWNCASLKRNGRRGHRQFGVDLFGLDPKGDIVALQCKLFDTGRGLSESDVSAEVENAKAFNPPIHRYAIVTTASRAPSLQRMVVEISQRHKSQGLFSVEIFFWDDLEELLNQYRTVADAIYGGISSTEARKIGDALAELKHEVHKQQNAHRELVDELLTQYQRQLSDLQRDNEELRGQLSAALRRAEKAVENGDQVAKSALDMTRDSGDTSKLLQVLLAERAKSRDEVLELNREIATVAHISGQLTLAESALAEILALYPDDIHALNHIGILLAEKHELRRAEEFLRRMHDVADQAHDARSVSMALGNLGMVYSLAGDPESAEDALNRALEIQIKLGWMDAIANQYSNLAKVRYHKGDKPAAEQFARKSLEIQEREKNRRGQASAYAVLGNILFSRGDTNGAESAHARALRLFEEEKDLAGMEIQYGNLGNIHAAKEEFSLAESMCRKALDIAKRRGRPISVINHLYNLGMIQRYLGDTQEWAAALEEALSLSEECGYRLGTATILGSMAEIFLEDGKLHNAREAVGQAMALEQELQRPEGIARRYATMGRISIASGDLTQARSLLKHARSLFAEIEAVHMVRMVDEMLESLTNRG